MSERQADRQKDKQTDEQTDRMTDRKTKPAKNFSAQLSKQNLFRMSTGCQKVGQTNRKIDRAPGRQTKQQIKRENYIETDRMTVWQNDRMTV